jgi:cytoskeletal protein CcmA (bactofilin family)
VRPLAVNRARIEVAKHRPFVLSLSKHGLFRVGNKGGRMFGKKSETQTTTKAAARRGSFSVLGAEVAVTGDITAADLHLDGRIEGDVICGALVLGADGRIAGSLTAESARIAGAIDGAVSVGALIVERTARISGDVAYQTITIEPGAQVDGQLRRIATDAETPLTIEVKPEQAPRLFAEESSAA